MIVECDEYAVDLNEIINCIKIGSGQWIKGNELSTSKIVCGTEVMVVLMYRKLHYKIIRKFEPAKVIADRLYAVRIEGKSST